jgi:hypothetical protein
LVLAPGRRFAARSVGRSLPIRCSSPPESTNVTSALRSVSRNRF